MDLVSLENFTSKHSSTASHVVSIMYGNLICMTSSVYIKLMIIYNSLVLPHIILWHVATWFDVACMR